MKQSEIMRSADRQEKYTKRAIGELCVHLCVCMSTCVFNNKGGSPRTC